MIAATNGFQVDLIALGAAVVLLALNAFFVAAEFALLAARRSRMEQLEAEGDKRATSALSSMREVTVMLAGAQLGITMCSLGLGAVAEPAVALMIESALGETVSLSDTTSHAIGLTVALSIIVFFHMVIGEMAPKSWAISSPESSALRLARPFRLFVTIFRPIILLLNRLAAIVVRMFGVEPQAGGTMSHSASDLRLLLDESADHGDIDQHDHALLTRSLELSGRTAANAMTARRDIVTMHADATAAEIEAEAHRTGRTRIVVIDNDLDHPIGFVHAKDLLRLADGPWQAATARSMARPLMATPEHHGLEDLLLEMRTTRQHISLAIDEHGTVVGLVTLEDVIEKLIGNFDDESDDRVADCQRNADGTFRINGTLRPDELLEHTGIEIPEGDWHTVAGYVIDTFGGIPSAGDRVTTEAGEFIVVEMDGYAIATIGVRPTISV